VRSEKDPFTLMRLIRVNIFNTLKILELTKHDNLKNFFNVSTDKATNPVNLMGASKKIMEKFLVRESESQHISLARFANVAFSDGSLLHGFNQRIIKKQPLSAPKDIERYFITSQESGELCLFSSFLGENRDIFFPKLSKNLELLKFSEIAENYLKILGYEPYHCENENQAKELSESLIDKGKWPCHFFESDTTGEKPFEEFFSEHETLDLNKFTEIGIVKNQIDFDEHLLNSFESKILKLLDSKFWNKEDIVKVFKETLPDFIHEEKNKYLDEKM
jgi:FlaA1/EpsC-like NDP-sugar epimerase